MKIPASAVTLLIAIIGVAPTASGSAFASIYSVTDLGAGYTLESNAGGQDYGVANSTGSVVYAFDKSPVTAINIYSVPPGIHATGYELLTMQNGAHQVGYGYDRTPIAGFYYYPTFESLGNGWDTAGGSPVSDINSQGQVVGTSLLRLSWPTYAAFSTVSGQSHGFAAGTVDNLNNYIAAIPGVTLTSAFKIDDLGRILADGSNGDVYLLTPTALGPPAMAPEPSAMALLAVASAGWLARRRLRR